MLSFKGHRRRRRKASSRPLKKLRIFNDLKDSPAYLLFTDPIHQTAYRPAPFFRLNKHRRAPDSEKKNYNQRRPRQYGYSTDSSVSAVLESPCRCVHYRPSRLTVLTVLSSCDCPWRIMKLVQDESLSRVLSVVSSRHTKKDRHLWKYFFSRESMYACTYYLVLLVAVAVSRHHKKFHGRYTSSIPCLHRNTISPPVVTNSWTGQGLTSRLSTLL